GREGGDGRAALPAGGGRPRGEPRQRRGVPDTRRHPPCPGGGRHQASRPRPQVRIRPALSRGGRHLAGRQWSEDVHAQEYAHGARERLRMGGGTANVRVATGGAGGPPLGFASPAAVAVARSDAASAGSEAPNGGPPAPPVATRGFTLLEVVLAMTALSMVIGICYGA